MTLRPGDIAEAFARARTEAGMGRDEEAAASIEEILAADPRHLGALLLKAWLLGEEREWDESLALTRHAAALWPRSAEAQNALARCLHGLGKDDEALERAEAARALVDEGDNGVHAPAVYLTLVWCLREKKRYRDAVAAAEEGLDRAPDAVLAQWASQVQDELRAAEKERC
jgi:tetratricopeptide (TPR) repeat protein